MQFFAHSSRISSDRSQWQMLRHHLHGVADGASEFARKFGAHRLACLAGRGHDLGKYTEEYLDRISGSGSPVDHSTAGAYQVLEGLAASPDRLTAELAAYAIAGHHTGLPDMHGSASSLRHRLANYRDNLSPVWRSEIDLERTDLVPRRFSFNGHDGKRSMPFRFAMLARFVFSCLVDADYRDTERYYDRLSGIQRDRDFRPFADLVPEFIRRIDAHMRKLAGRPRKNLAVAQARAEILSAVQAKASSRPGLYTLTVPTGGGKTLAALSFALRHAAANQLDRVITCIPFTSVVDQTSEIYRDVLGAEHVLEHHSGIGEDHHDTTEGKKLRMAAEDWSAPVIVTTNVQFFETLMSARPGKARKLHNISRSVIILDEAQTIPRHLLVPCVALLDELVRNYGCTVLFCTATQPALSDAVLPVGHPLALPLSGKELAPDPNRLKDVFRRVRFEHAGEMSNAQLVEALGEQRQALVIVNSRKHAFDLFKAAKSHGIEDVFHLSTRQTAFDRRRILEIVRRRLAVDLPCRVVATSLIEAGVDIDFPKVWRCEAGLDQIAQAAGRCNREGLRPVEESVVTIFSSSAYPPPHEMKGMIRDMKAAVRRHGDILSPAAVSSYFQETYWRVGDEGLDGLGIMDLFKMSPEGTDFSFRSADAQFNLIGSGERSVIIADAPEAKAALLKASDASVRSLQISRLLQAHTVNVPEKVFERLLATGKVMPESPSLRDGQFMVLRDPALYDPEVGLIWD